MPGLSAGPNAGFRKTEWHRPGKAAILAHRRSGTKALRRQTMINKLWTDALTAVAQVRDGAVIGIGGFGDTGVPEDLVNALIDHGARGLTIVSNNAGNGDIGIAALLKAGRVDKVVCSFPRSAHSHVFDGLYRSGRIALELVPQGTLAERLRASGAGIGGFYTPTSFGTALAEGKETRTMAGRDMVLEQPLALDVALIKAEQGDRWGNLTYRKVARNFGPVMATAARCTIASVAEVVTLGALDPESIVTPGIFVHRLVTRTQPSQEARAA